MTYLLLTYLNLFLLRKNRKQRLENIALSIDCTLLSILTLGKSYPFESISSAAWRAEGMGLFFGRARKHIDKIWFVLFKQSDHCKMAYFNAKKNLPEDQR